jgi:three-Cys-motif partner protein
MASSWFDDPREQSVVRAAIVSKYFGAWARVIMSSVRDANGKIAYIDLFAGPGRYDDGTKSTPLLVLETALQDARMRQMLVTIFNDKDEQNAHSLEEAISQVPGVDALRYPPKVHSHEVGDNIVNQFERMRLIPTLIFVDPWGYKGLSLRLVNAVLKNWGCDCIFFFNYNRINMGLNNEAVEEHMNALFGSDRADQLRTKLLALKPHERELMIVEELSQALKGYGPRYVLPFRFKNDKGNRTSHHLIFVSKHFRGYEIMKQIMAKESSSNTQGVASFEYNPADERQPLLFELSAPVDELADNLLQCFAGRTLSMKRIYEEHNVGKPFVSRNYKDVLIQLEANGRITAHPPAASRKAKTFGDDVLVTVPALAH